MVRRRGDEHYPWCGVAYFSDESIHLISGKLPPFAGFCTLGHFNLQLISVNQVIAGNPEAG